jgi:isoquinoline 1-oxidoreductase beta subunit
MSAQKFDRLCCDVTKCGSGWNFYDYYVPRMNDIPESSVIVVPTNNHPTGVGQMATPLVAPAIANAVAELTGVRLRHTP